MTDQKNAIPRIVYLFGAGATQAELSQTVKEKLMAPKFLKDNGLLISEVSKRVTIKAQSQEPFKKIDFFFPSNGSSNIELLISLIEDNTIQIRNSLRLADILKKLVRKDIKRVLTSDIRKRFYLHKALLELDKKNREEQRENILGYISLNYDTVLDEAYREIIDKKPNYCLSPYQNQSSKIPLLKLHGSFKWYSNLDIAKNLPILPLGMNKNYLQLPYNYIWGHALEILADCDILRVIGCSLSTNDFRLIDLLFKAYLLKKGSFEIHVIDFDENGDSIKERYKFFQGIKNYSEIFGAIGNNSREIKGTNESFQDWLKLKAVVISDAKKNETNYLKKIIT